MLAIPVVSRDNKREPPFPVRQGPRSVSAHDHDPRGVCGMNATRTSGVLVILVGLALATTGGDSPAQGLYNKGSGKGEVALPPPADVQSLAVFPTKVSLKGQDDSQQLIISGTLKDGRLQDFSGDVKYEVADKAVVGVTSAGRVMPLANGATTVTATYG